MQSRAWRIHSYSGFRGLTLDRVDIEEPGPTDIRIKVEAFALNWGDTALMRDRYSFSFDSLPARVGIEAAGIVDAVGEEVTDLSVGDRVSTLPYFYYNRGVSADHVVVDRQYVTRPPANLSTIESASIWMQYLTAYYPLAEICRLGPGDAALVTAATSTAGAAALEIGRELGVTMIGTTRSADNIAYLRERGAADVIVTGVEDVAARITRITGGRGVDLAFDSVGAGLIGQYVSVLARDAQICYYGELDGGRPELPYPEMYQKRAVFRAYSVFSYIEDREARDRGIAFITDLLASGRIRPSVDRVFPMEQYVDAWEYLLGQRQTHGKVVIETGA